MGSMKNKALIADAALVLVAFVWGTGFPISKVVLKYVTPLFILFFRFTLSTLLMGIIFWKRIKYIRKYDLVAGLICGIFLFGGFATQTIGLQFTTASKQAFLTGTYVVIVPFLYWALSKKRPDNYNIAAAFMTLFGIWMLSMNGGFSIGIGDSLTLICAFFFAGQIVAIGYFAKKCDTTILSILQMMFAAIFSSILAFNLESYPQNVNIEGWLSLAYLVVFSTTVAFFIQNTAQKYTQETHTAILLSLEAVFGSLMSIMLLGDYFTPKMILGCIIIFLGIITAETKWSFITSALASHPSEKKSF